MKIETYENTCQHRRLRIGLPSRRSRLHCKAMNILDCQLESNNRQLVFTSQETAVFFLRPWDLPTLVARGNLDIAICGLDTVIELKSDVVVYECFKAMRSLIALCARQDTSNLLVPGNSIVVATEYPNISEEFFNKHNTPVQIQHIHGAAEAYPYLEDVSAIVDVVESGRTLAANGLSVVEIVTYTYPCLVLWNGLNTTVKDLGIENLSRLVAAALRNPGNQ